MSTEPYRMVAHVKEGLLPVLVIADDLSRRDRKGRPMYLCEATRAVGGIAKGQRVWVTKTMLSCPTDAKPRTNASKRRDRRKIMDLAAHNRLAQGGAADGTDTQVPTRDAQSVRKPVVSPVRELPALSLATAHTSCDVCLKDMPGHTLNGVAVTTCPGCKALFN